MPSPLDQATFWAVSWLMAQILPAYDRQSSLCRPALAECLLKLFGMLCHEASHLLLMVLYQSMLTARELHLTCLLAGIKLCCLLCDFLCCTALCAHDSKLSHCIAELGERL